MLPEQLTNEAIVAICGVAIAGLQICNLLATAYLHRCLDRHTRTVAIMHRQNVARLDRNLAATEDATIRISPHVGHSDSGSTGP